MSSSHVVDLPERNPEPRFSKAELVFSEAEKKQLAQYKTQYPTAEGAVMRALWVAQEKFGFLPPEVIRLVASELDIPYATTYGVATFYTQYYKKEMGTYVLDVCTCFSCQMCGGYDMLHYLEDKLGIGAGETTEDGRFSIQSVECLGACGSAPMLQVTNEQYVYNLTEEKLDALVDALRTDKPVPFTSVTLPQDEDEMGGNRRSDIEADVLYETPRFAKRVD